MCIHRNFKRAQLAAACCIGSITTIACADDRTVDPVIVYRNQNTGLQVLLSAGGGPGRPRDAHCYAALATRANKAILIAGGIPVPEATAVAVDTLGNRYLLKKAADVPRRIKEGNLLSAVLADVDYFPGMMVEVVKVGESSGNLIDVLNKNADFYENAIDMRINTLVSLIEPILIIGLGVVIAFMLISVYLPIFQTIQVIR